MDIFGKKRLEQLKFELNEQIVEKLKNIDKNIYLFDEEITKKFKSIENEIKSLSAKFDRLIEELKKVSEVTPIPIKPTIRDGEKVYNEEKKQEEEKYAYNLYKN